MTIQLTSDDIHHIKEALEKHQLDLQESRHCSRNGSAHLIAGYDRDIEEVAALRGQPHRLNSQHSPSHTMSTNITLTYFGVSGSGPTVKAAKEQAGRKLQSYAESGPRIHIIAHRAISTGFILWRDLAEGWQYRSVPVGETLKVHLFTGCCMLGECDEKQAIRRTVAHLAGLTSDAAVAKELIYRHCGTFANSEWDTWRSRAAFQLAAKAYPGDRENSALIHQWACEHSGDFLSQVAA